MIHSDTWDLPIGILIISHFNETFTIPQNYFLAALLLSCSATHRRDISPIHNYGTPAVDFLTESVSVAANSIVFYC